jgi:hypothetical protein
MGTCSSSRSCSMPSHKAKPPHREPLLPPSLARHRLTNTAASAPSAANFIQSSTGLPRRDQDVGPPLRSEVGRQHLHEPRRDTTPVGAAIQGEVLPRVRISFAGFRGKIGWVRKDQVETSQPRREIGAHSFDGEPFVPSAMENRRERGGIEVGGDNETSSMPC